MKIDELKTEQERVQECLWQAKKRLGRDFKQDNQVKKSLKKSMKSK
jgi:hypothetical protein